MPYDSRLVGQQTSCVEHEVDSRWLMAYAAGIGDCNPSFMDTAAGGIIGHPLFPVCLEWPVHLSLRELQFANALTREEAARGVHATHDLHVYKPIIAGKKYTTIGRVVSLKTLKPGAAQMLRLDTRDASGDLVCTTWQTSIARGVDVVGGNKEFESPPDLPRPGNGSTGGSYEVSVAEGAANIYTETAKIYNPIHSDKAFALSAGLPGIILHGTATLAIGVSELIKGHLGGNPFRVKRVGGRFTGMVLMPNVLIVNVVCVEEAVLHFVIHDSEGQVVFDQGFLCFC